jgi:hypothetical protein
MTEIETEMAAIRELLEQPKADEDLATRVAKLEVAFRRFRVAEKIPLSDTRDVPAVPKPDV